MTGKFHGLGTDGEAAKQIAIEANSRLAERQMAQLLKVRDEISREQNKGISVSAWVEKYLAIQSERLESGEIRLNTHKQKMAPLKAFVSEFGLKSIDDITVRDIADLLDQYKERGQNRMAQIVRMVLIDLYKEAQHAGEAPPGFNPALATKMPRNKVQRERLNFDEWSIIFDAAAALPNYVQNSMLLALVTGQRLGDIAKMQFSDIWDGHLHIQQEKTGTKLAIPLSLRCNALNMTLEDVISRCRDRILSKFVIHHHHTTAQAKRGEALTISSITTGFSKARKMTTIDWKNGSPPTFHEQRSLAERLYRDQGMDTKRLLGHKNQVQTDKYNDDRGKEWLIVAI